MRFEESSKQEIQDWKEQYLRAEQERVKLSARLDQLIAEQLEASVQSSLRLSIGSSYGLHYQSHGGQYDPRAGPSYTNSSSTAQPKPRKSVPKQPRASTSTAAPPEPKSKTTSGYTTDRERTYVENAPRPATPKDANAMSARTPKQKADQRGRPAATTNATPRASTSRLEPSPPSMPQSRLIRRVNAVIEVPVKEEEYSDDEALSGQPYEESSASGSEYVPEKRKRAVAEATRRRSSTGAKGKQKTQSGRYVEIDDPDEESEADQLLIGSEVSHALVNETFVLIAFHRMTPMGHTTRRAVQERPRPSIHEHRPAARFHRAARRSENSTKILLPALPRRPKVQGGIEAL